MSTNHITKFCRYCGATRNSDRPFCNQCGADLRKKATAQKPQLIFKSKSNLRKLFAALISIVIFVASIMIYKKYYYTPLSNESFIYTYNPQPIKRSGTPPLDIYPIAELHLIAEADALDRVRDFQAIKLSTDELQPYIKGLKERNALAVAGFKLDAGMTKADRFPGELIVGFDLTKLPLPKAYWQFAEILNLDENGHFTRMVSKLDGSELQCRLRHNGILIVTLTTLALAIPGFAVINQVQKGMGELAYWDKTDSFCVYWPVSANLAPQNPQALQYVQELADLFRYHTGLSPKDLEGKITEFGFATERYFEWILKQPDYQRYFEDARVQELMRLIGDSQWRRTNLWPMQVENTITALERANKYLTAAEGSCRKFRKPNWVIDVYIRSDWQEADTINGLCQDKPFTYPYIDIRLTAIPTVLTISTEDDQNKLDELHTTCLHELFHAISKYNYIEWEQDIWFAEACAVTLEHEAQDYYKQFVKNFKTTQRDYWKYYQLPMDTSLWSTDQMNSIRTTFDTGVESDHSLYQDHGYTASYFFEYLRSKYYQNNANDFLPNLLENFASWHGGTINSLINVTSQNADEFGQLFLSFCLEKEHSINIEKSLTSRQEAALTVTKPYYYWPLQTHLPILGAPMRNISLAAIPETDLQNAKVVLKASKFPQKEHVVRWRPYATSWSDVIDKEAIIDYAGLVNKNRAGVYLQQIIAYPDSGKLHNGHAATLFVLLRPQAPTVTVTEQSIKISWLNSPLMNVDCIRGYQVAIDITGDVAGEKEIIKTLSENYLEIPFSELLTDNDKNQYSNINLSIRYREQANTESEIYGEWSAIVYKTIDTKAPTDEWFLSDVKISDINPFPEAEELTNAKFSANSFAGHYKIADNSNIGLDLFIEGEWGAPPEKLKPSETLSLPVTITRTWVQRPQEAVRTGFIAISCGSHSEAYEQSGTFNCKIPYGRLGERMIVEVHGVLVNYFYQHRKVSYIYVYGGKDIPEPQIPRGTNPLENYR